MEGATRSAQSEGAGEIVPADAARAILRTYEDLFARADVPAILSGFTDDVRVRFAEVGEFRGKPALELFLRARFARQRSYRLRKTLIATGLDLIVGGWTGEWTDGVTGREMQGRGIECIRLRGALCAEWDAVFNVWEVGGEPATRIV